MPTDCLIVSAGQLAAGVEAVIAGVAPETAAAQTGVAYADLTDAVYAYRAAGLAALQRRADRVWFHALVAPQDWASTERAFASQVAPRLDSLDEGQAAWWFLRKYPYWRLRIRIADQHAAGALLDELVAGGMIDHWRPGIYEPETAAFGGGSAIPIVHDLFCADSRGVLTFARQPTPQLGRRELSLLLIRALQQQAGLDWFEAGDVFDRVAQLRPIPADANATRIDTLATRMRPLLAIPVQADSELFGEGGAVAYAADWLAGFIHAGRRLGEAAAAGRLDRGLRAVLAHIVIFHWNRLGLSAVSQGILAHAAKTSILPRS